MEPRGILRGGWLDGRLIGLVDKEELVALGPGLLPPEGMVFLSSSGRTLPSEIKDGLVRYQRTQDLEGDLIVYEYIQ